ncbi:MAG: hypothetical protein WBM44_15185 [Waterburya sp.]
MTYATAVKPVEAKTCSTCPYFNNFQEPNGRGWCKLFDHQARKHHQQTLDCISSSDLEISHELEDNLDIFSNVELDAFPTEEIEDEADQPHSEYEIGSIVKVIDPEEHHEEWAVFEVIDCKYNTGLYRHLESYLNQSQWYFRLASYNDTTSLSKSLWVAETEICHFDQSHLICTQDIF